jgi:hypothetical protein
VCYKKTDLRLNIYSAQDKIPAGGRIRLESVNCRHPDPEPGWADDPTAQEQYKPAPCSPPRSTPSPLFRTPPFTSPRQRFRLSELCVPPRPHSTKSHRNSSLNLGWLPSKATLNMSSMATRVHAGALIRRPLQMSMRAGRRCLHAAGDVIDICVHAFSSSFPEHGKLYLQNRVNGERASTGKKKSG